ncbi:NTP transferase domain-containing protein [Rufibacter sp. XAAS-G3-1]|uniref:NTP transferase domain-containing protein n=1 Tax=Rufibacter sp. XAAS-G3-1 TaxID=2729134 RepID=UPI001C63678C|nr:NTP transferase domain-containing protein [Rufibacter sp. XAAS-G3-1]
MKDHKKHRAITQPAYGNYSRLEWALLGTTCGTIKTLAESIINALTPDYRCGYVDAQHTKDQEEPETGRLGAGARLEYTDQITFDQFHFQKPLSTFQFRQIFSEMDAVLVNGNHQQAKAQVVIMDENKKASLQKRIAQLTNVQLILLADNADSAFDFVQEAIPVWQEIPLFRLHETGKIVSFFQKQLKNATPVLNGLVLAGGRSLRMGQDKGAIAWHGKEQRYHVADQLKGLCQNVFISCRAEQQASLEEGYATLPDTFTALGPYGAILSAFREQPDAAWLVVACDLPLLDTATLRYLVANRAVSALATTFESPHDGFPEPLITIWEPKSYPVLLSFLAQGYTCPRKVLRNSEIHSLKPLNPDALLNVNTPEEVEKAKQKMT